MEANTFTGTLQSTMAILCSGGAGITSAIKAASIYSHSLRRDGEGREGGPFIIRVAESALRVFGYS